VLVKQFERIYGEYSRQLYNYALWMTRDRQTSDDVLQAAFVKVWKCRRVPEEGEGLKSWLFTLTRNTCLDHLRRQTRLRRLRAQYARECARAAVIEEEEPQVWRSLGGLSETERSILYMHIRIGYSYAEIGRMLDLTENNVRVKAFRALRRLRSELRGKV
jgi:RNA polymerase sigma-70 factor (ECF subfamily)